MTNFAYALLLSLILAPSGLRPFGLVNSSVEIEDDVTVRDGWVQEGPPSQTITAAFMVIENHTANEVSLQSADTDVAKVVELHKIDLVDGMMRMHRVDSIDIPSGGSVELKPGGYHLMVIGLKKVLKGGDKVTVNLKFSHDIRKTITIPVKPRTAVAG